MFKKDGEFKFSKRGIDRVIEEKGSTFMALRQIAWNVSDDEDVEPDKIKLDLRKYRMDDAGNEVMQKGVSFMTEEGPNELVHVMLEENFGDTEKCIKILKNRSNFKDAVKAAYGDKVSDDTFDLRDII